MTMFFYDEYEYLEEYRRFREQDQPLISEYERLHRSLRQAEAALKGQPRDQEKAARVAQLQEELEALEQRAPWLKLDYPLEYLLWGPPHG